jgi:mannosyltransferase OCH1-like enzyme
MMTNKNFPKIIHQTGPSDLSKWHPIWTQCQESWKKTHPDYEYIFWNDEDLENFIKTEYSDYYKIWKECPVHISQIDLARYFILYHYGGIFSDLDIFCYRKFEDKITHGAMAIQAISESEIVGNCLMLGEKAHKFFKLCFEMATFRLQSIKKMSSHNKHGEPEKIYADYSTGPRLISDALMCYNSKSDLGVLPTKHFVHDAKFYSEDVVARHMLSGMWGKDILNVLLKYFAMYKTSYPETTFEEFKKLNYKTFRDVDVENLDFYKNYKRV